jgi:CreA protein
MKRIGIILGGGIILVIVLFGWWIISRPERGTTGSVSTHFRWLGPNDKIVIDSFNDPKVQGVACYIARAQTGGVKGGLGVAEDTSDASISCRQVGPIKILGELKDGESVFDEHRSLVFKKLQVVRFFDRERNVLVYVAYSDRVIEGSPKNSISTVPIMGWPAPYAKKSGAGAGVDHRSQDRPVRRTHHGAGPRPQKCDPEHDCAISQKVRFHGDPGQPRNPGYFFHLEPDSRAL